MVGSELYANDQRVDRDDPQWSMLGAVGALCVDGSEGGDSDGLCMEPSSKQLRGDLAEKGRLNGSLTAAGIFHQQSSQVQEQRKRCSGMGAMAKGANEGTAGHSQGLAYPHLGTRTIG